MLWDHAVNIEANIYISEFFWALTKFGHQK